MKLRGIEFGSVGNAAGARNFFGEGYWFHRLPKSLCPDFGGATFVAKTTTLLPRPGNMPLVVGSTVPKEWFPRCIAVNWRKGAAVNAVGLSGPGADWLLTQLRWQLWPEPFFLSFCPGAGTSEGRLTETEEFVELLSKYLWQFRAPVGLQLNVSCPNIGHDPTAVVQEAGKILDRLGVLRIPVAVKFNVLAPLDVVWVVSDHPACDALVMGNTVPWEEVPETVRVELFGSDRSPLEERGLPTGGLSGRPLLRYVVRWIERARHAGFGKPIVGCGGILSVEDAFAVLDAGAMAIELGSVAFLRPWRVQRIVRAVTRRVQQTGVSHEHPEPAGTR